MTRSNSVTGTRCILALCLALGPCLSPAIAGDDAYRGDATHNPNALPGQRYDGPDYCPAGFSPIVQAGMISCGEIGFPVARDGPDVAPESYFTTTIHSK